MTAHQSCATAVEAAKEEFPVDQVVLGESCKTEVTLWSLAPASALKSGHRVMKNTEIQFTYARATGLEAGVAQQARPHDERLSAETALLCSHTMRLPSFLPQQMVRPRSSVQHDVLMRCDRSAEPLASIWVQPCSVVVDPKEKCGFKIQVSPPFSSMSFKPF